jgi:hypothetical protein
MSNSKEKQMGEKELNLETVLNFEDGSKSTLGAELAEIDKCIAEYKEAIVAGEALSRFSSSEEFDLLFNKMYVDGESERLRQALVNPSIFRKEVIDNMTSMMSGIRHFKQFLDTVASNAAMAPSQIEDLEDRRMQITASVSE